MNIPRHMVWLLLALALVLPAQAADNFTSAYISEFVVDNRHGLKDDDGDRSGWIELHNGGRATVNLSGWFLTDDPNNPAKWRFPGVALLPDKHMVIFASGKNRTNILAHLHTNFRLRTPGFYLALAGPATNIVSAFTSAPPTFDTAWGCVRGEPALRGNLQSPTPDKPNTINGPGFAPEVVFSRASGSFTKPFSLQLSTPSSNAVIRYTLNGTLPNSRSPVCDAPLQITNSTQVRVRAYQEGLLPGPPRSETYLRLQTNVLDFTSSLPVLVMDTFGIHRPTTPQSISAHLSFYEPINGRTSLTNPPTLVTHGGFHNRGSSSRGMPQPSFALQLLDEFNEEHHRPVLGLPADSDWVLYAPNCYDPGMIHNPFAHQLSRFMGRYSPRTRFVEVYLVQDSGPVSSRHYHGIYVLEEKIKVGRHRVDIDRVGPEDLQPPQVTGGYLLKIDRLGPGEAGFGAAGAGMVYVEPKEPLISLPQRAPQREYLQSFFRDFERALNGPKWKDPVLGYRAYVDVDAWIDFHVLEVLSGNVDVFGLSTYFHKPRNGKLTFGPHWDFDRALGSTDGRDANPRNWNCGPYFGGAWWNKLFTDPDFWQQWVDRWQELRQTHFSQTSLFGLADLLANEVREAHPREVARWGLQPRGGSYQSEIDHMKNWLSNRLDFIDRQLVPPPRFDHAGGRVARGFLLSLNASTNATIHYTLDGTDPRQPQGAVLTNALVYSGPIPIRSNIVIVARARNPNQHQTGGPPSSTPWSSPVTAKFVVTPR